MNPVGNWWFSLGIAALFTGLGWIVTARVVAPRLGAWHGERPAATEWNATALTTAQRTAAWAAGLGRAVSSWRIVRRAVSRLYPGFTPLYDEAAAPGQRLSAASFAALATSRILSLFLARDAGWA